MYYGGMVRVGVDLESFVFFWEEGWGKAELSDALIDQILMLN